MKTTLRVVVSGIALALVTWSCMPPVCALPPSPPESVCHRADAGTIAPDASFVLEGVTYFQAASCQVTIDGGAINLLVNGASFCGSTGGSSAVRAPDKVLCAIPALAAGTYVVNSDAPTTFTIPESADAGVPVCP